MENHHVLCFRASMVDVDVCCRVAGCCCWLIVGNAGSCYVLD